MNLPMLSATDAPLLLENIPALQEEVRELAARRHGTRGGHRQGLHVSNLARCRNEARRVNEL